VAGVRYGEAELQQKLTSRTAIICRCPDCDGAVPVCRDWPPAALPIQLAVICRRCHQVWTIIKDGERIVGRRTLPAWPNR
jgi:hypothetical protein